MMMKGLINQQQPQEENMSNLTSASGEASGSSGNRNENGSMYSQQYLAQPPSQTQTQTQSLPVKRKRNLPGNPDPDAEVIALSPKTLLTTNRFLCEICNKGFQRDQNLQLHRRGHNLPWKLKQRTSKEVRKKVYVCPEPSCVHHDPLRALGDLTGIKKHFFRKHGEKKWKCEKCSKRYAVQSDWKAHSKTCGTKEYRCDCGTLFSRRDSFITHRAFCDALAEESARAITGNANPLFTTQPTGSSSTSHISLQVQPHQFDTHDHHLHHQVQQAFSLKKEPQAFTLRPEFPPWLTYPQAVGAGLGPPPPPSQTDLSSSIFPTRFDHQDFRDNSHDLSSPAGRHESRNPNPTSLGPTLPPYHPTASPHISATALLQKAAQMGATMSSKTGTTAAAQTMLQGPHQTHVSSETSNNNTTGFSLNLSSREELATGFINNLASSYGNKAAGIGTTGTASGTSGGPPPPSNLLLHDMMTFEGSTFDDAFGGFLNPNKKDHHHHHIHETLSRTTGEAAGGGNGGGGSTSGANNDGMTRDFLGLRPLSHSDIFNIAGLGNCMNTSSNDNQKPWQG